MAELFGEARTAPRACHLTGNLIVKMEMLENGSVDCPLIRISGDEPAVCLRLKRVFERLA
jgi:hypothetical protein